MKKVLLLFISIFCLASCEITEKIYFDEDHQVTYSIESNLTQLMKLEPNKEQALAENYPIDTVMTIEEFGAWDLMNDDNSSGDFQKESFKELFKDFNVHVKLSQEDSYFSLFTKQNSVQELNNVLSDLKRKALKYEEEEGETAPQNKLYYDYMFQNNQFNFDGKTLERNSELNMNNIQELLNKENGDMGLTGFFYFTRYNVEYHFPRPIKSISDKKAKVSLDRKTAFIEKSMDDILSNPNTMDIVIELQD
ncbi:hypothetical protein GO491_05645 [Flavobacteriaceae bacterium Ap0902]|nr:hypothetical protein [Flavobacteriaceae bacterium Ap0902]